MEFWGENENFFRGTSKKRRSEIKFRHKFGPPVSEVLDPLVDAGLPSTCSCHLLPQMSTLTRDVFRHRRRNGLTGDMYGGIKEHNKWKSIHTRSLEPI